MLPIAFTVLLVSGITFCGLAMIRSLFPRNPYPGRSGYPAKNRKYTSRT